MATDAERTAQSVKYIEFSFTGNVTSSETDRTTEYYDGELLRLVTSPSGSQVPSANWDLVVKDDDGIDILNGGGANRSSDTVEQVLGSTVRGPVANSRLRFIISNASSTGGGTIRAYIR